MSRRREREGRHVSIGGEAAEEVLETLVNQFADPYTFIRELLQNSLDARAARIDVRMRWEAGTLTVEVADDGEGMDRPIIEGYLLTLFRSTKEDDLTKIGKFGIGFTSIFAMEPREVVVDTGRDGIWHRVVFDTARQYTLSRLADPYEGTTVTLKLARGQEAASRDAERIREAMIRWCRYADATITVRSDGTTPSWPEEAIRAVFSVDSPVTVRAQGDGFEAVLGIHRGPPPVGFYNRGITLWESEEAMLPGVCFRVAGRHLEHTLTRDNVIRDRHFDTIMGKLRDAARDVLGPAVHAALEAAVKAGDVAQTRRICAALGDEVPWDWDEARALLPGVPGVATSSPARSSAPRGGSDAGQELLDRAPAGRRGSAEAGTPAIGLEPRPLTLRQLAPGWTARLTRAKGELLCATADCLVGRALATERAVVLGEPGDAHVRWAAARVNAEPKAANAAYGFVEAVEPAPARGGDERGSTVAGGGESGASPAGSGVEAPPDRHAVIAAAGRALGVDVTAARFHGLLAGKLVTGGRPGSLVSAPTTRGPLAVNVDHPLVAKLTVERAGGVVLAVAIGAELGRAPDPRLVDALPGAMAGRDE